MTEPSTPDAQTANWTYIRVNDNCWRCGSGDDVRQAYRGEGEYGSEAMCKACRDAAEDVKRNSVPALPLKHRLHNEWEEDYEAAPFAEWLIDRIGWLEAENATLREQLQEARTALEDIRDITADEGSPSWKRAKLALATPPAKDGL